MVYAFGPFVLDRPKRMLLRDGAPVALTPKSLDLLSLLVDQHGQVVTKEALMAALWPDTVVEESNLTFQISALRKALGEGRFIITIPGRGYQFSEPVQRAEPPAAAAEAMPRRASRRWSWRWLAAAALLIVVAVTFFVLRRTQTPSGIDSIAVLPFRPLAALQRDESLELGMADTLITRLSHIPGVVIRPTSAVRRYTKLDQDPLAAGRDLRVDAVLDGSIQRSGERMRVTVRLLRTGDGEPMWAAQFDESARDLFAVQDRVADGVARAVVPSLSAPQEKLLAKKSTNDLAAYDLYVKGVYVRELDRERAREFFERALTHDRKFAAAWAGIADTWLMQGRFMDDDPRDAFEHAQAAAEKAIALDPDLAAGHAVLAAVYSDWLWRWDDAEREYERALALNPNDALTHAWYSSLLLYRRKTDRALEHSARAVELDPMSPIVATTRGMVLRSSGHVDEAIRALEETVRLHEFPASSLHLAMALASAGRGEEGMERLRPWVERGSVSFAALYAYAAARAGKREEALRVIHEIETNYQPREVAAMNIAVAWTALGEPERAFAWLEVAYAKHNYLLRVIAVEPGFDPIRNDPRFADLLRRMGL